MFKYVCVCMSVCIISRYLDLVHVGVGAGGEFEASTCTDKTLSILITDSAPAPFPCLLVVVGH